MIIKQKHNYAVDKFNESRNIIIEQHEALKENQKLIKEMEKQQKKEFWKGIGIGLGAGAGLCLIIGLVVKFVPN